MANPFFLYLSFDEYSNSIDSFALENPDLFNLTQKTFRAPLRFSGVSSLLIRDNIEGQYYHIETTDEDVRGDYYQPHIEFDFAVRRFYDGSSGKQSLTVYIKNIRLKFKQNWNKYFENSFKMRISDAHATDYFETYLNIPNTLAENISIPETITTDGLLPGYSETVITKIHINATFTIKYKNGWHD